MAVNHPQIKEIQPGLIRAELPDDRGWPERTVTFLASEVVAVERLKSPMNRPDEPRSRIRLRSGAAWDTDLHHDAVCQMVFKEL